MTTLRFPADIAVGEVWWQDARGLPPDSVCDLTVGAVTPGSFAAVAHLAPGLRELSLYIDNLGDDAPSVIASLRPWNRWHSTETRTAAGCSATTPCP